jgi:hypothetical protein
MKKEEEEKRVEKNGQVFKKREMNKIAHVL